MTDTEQRFALSMRQADDDEPGLIRERDGTVWLVNPDGTRTQLGAENGGSQPVLTISVTLTDAEIKALGTNIGFIEVVPAPGVGKALYFQAGFVTVDAVAGAYGNIDPSGHMIFTYRPLGGAQVSIPLPSPDLVGLLGGDGEVACAPFTPYIALDDAGGGGGAQYAAASYLDASQLEDCPISLNCENGVAGAFTGGDPSNSGRAQVWYSIVDLA